MCLIALAYRIDQELPLVVAANRDEFGDRPTAAAHFWEDSLGILAGRDLRAGGTWMGITRSGRFAAITNYRDLRLSFPDGPSRGALVRQALEHGIDPSASKRYAGFNLLYGPLGALRYHNNIDMRDEALEPGIHGLSNHLLDTPWPKVERAKERLKDLLAKPRQELVDGLFAMLADRTQAPSDQLPDTGLPLALERTASSIFIDAPGYRTRCSTVLVVDKHGRTHFEERTWPGGGTVTERFQLMGVAR